jgi:hypothetical protein
LAGSQNDGGVAVPPNIITDEKLDRTRAGTPQLALLTWWQAVQFRDVPVARQLTNRTSLERTGPTRFRRMVMLVGDGLPGLRILTARIRGDQAAIRAYLVFAPARTGDAAVGAPRTFGLSRAGRTWLVNNLEYLRASAEDVLRRREAASRGAGRSQPSGPSQTPTAPAG